jgi:hypothetical protein
LRQTRVDPAASLLALLALLAFAAPALAQTGVPDISGGSMLSPGVTTEPSAPAVASRNGAWAGALDVLRLVLDPARSAWGRSTEWTLPVRVPAGNGRTALAIRLRDGGAASARQGH